jgi:non-specific serine/threonine protein kinase
MAAHVREEGGTPIETTLGRAFQERAALLLLDNFEHVADAASVVGALLDAAPRLRVLVTSRVRLRLTGEQEVAVPPFEVEVSRDLAELERNDAVALFVLRARQVDPSFQLSEANAVSIAQLCARLDGLPLAIELAASRVRALPPEAILERLGKRLDLLRGGPRDAPARHGTLSEAIRWSDELLDPAASRLLRRLSVFAGGWTVDAADAVANLDLELGDDSVDLLEALMEHGLIRRDGARLRMLETVRTYAAERLDGDEDAGRIRERHAAFFLGVAERAERHTVDPGTLAEVGAEHDNMRAALRWLRDHDVGLGLRLGAALWRFWHLRGHLAEGRATLEDLLATEAASAAGLHRERAAALVALASVVYWQNDYRDARRAYEEAIGLAEAIGADEELGDALFGLAFVTRIEGDVRRALEVHTRARALFERLGDARRLAGATMAHGMVLADLDDLDEAERSIEEACRLFEELGDRLGASTALGALGQIVRRKGDAPRAAELYLRSADAGLEIDDESGIGVSLQALATMAGGRGDHETAVLLWSAGDALTHVGGARAPAELLDLVDPRPAAELAIGKEETERLWREGSALRGDQVIRLARERFGEA